MGDIVRVISSPGLVTAVVRYVGDEDGVVGVESRDVIRTGLSHKDWKKYFAW